MCLNNKLPSTYYCMYNYLLITHANVSTYLFDILWDWLRIKMTNDDLIIKYVWEVWFVFLLVSCLQSWRWCELQKCKFKWRYDRHRGSCNLNNCKLIWKKNFGTSTGFEPMTSVLALQAVLYRLSYEDSYIAPNVWWVCCLSSSFCFAACTSMLNF